MKNLILIIFIVKSSVAFSTGGPVSTNVVDPLACRISFWDSPAKSEFKGGCSGRLISKNQILTAAHCIAKDAMEYVEVKCQFSHLSETESRVVYSSKGTPSEIGMPKFGFTSSVEKCGIRISPMFGALNLLNDYAVLNLENEFPSEVSQQLTNTSFKNNPEKFSNCRLTGFGYHNGTTGIPRTGAFNLQHSARHGIVAHYSLNQSLSSSERELISGHGVDAFKAMESIMNKYAPEVSFTNGGDSGGSIVCDVSDEGSRVVAVVSHIGKSNGNDLNYLEDVFREVSVDKIQELQTVNPICTN